LLYVPNKVICSENSHHSLRVTAPDVNGSKSDGGSGPTSHWLDNKALMWHLWCLEHQFVHLVLSRDDQDILGLKERRDTVYRVLKHGPVTDK
jgi:hypothetical protein